tara:strand:- start:244 stop:534 length:291 start_codon:yes stop_codon:yes gene_type:complete
MAMMAWTETDGDGMNITVLYKLNKWSELNTVCELVEVNGEWTIETHDDTFTIDNPKGSSDEYLNALFGLNNAKTIDTKKPFMNFRSALISFDVWEV